MSEPNPAYATDREWWDYCQMCGGCGTDDCHANPCEDGPDRLGFSRGVCQLCPTRRATGQVA